MWRSTWWRGRRLPVSWRMRCASGCCVGTRVCARPGAPGAANELPARRPPGDQPPRAGRRVSASRARRCANRGVLEPAGCAEDRRRQIVGRAWGRRGSIESISERVPGGTISAVARVAFWKDPRFPWPGCVRGGDGGGGLFGWLSPRLSGALFLAPFSTPPVWRFNPREGGSLTPFGLRFRSPVGVVFGLRNEHHRPTEGDPK